MNQGLVLSVLLQIYSNRRDMWDVGWISFNVILPRNSDSDNDEFIIAITFATA